MPSLSAGDVVVLFDGTIRPPKHKWFVAVYVTEGWFFRLNSSPHWRPNFKLLQSENPCLEKDCFIEMNGKPQHFPPIDTPAPPRSPGEISPFNLGKFFGQYRRRPRPGQSRNQVSKNSGRRCLRGTPEPHRAPPGCAYPAHFAWPRASG